MKRLSGQRSYSDTILLTCAYLLIAHCYTSAAPAKATTSLQQTAELPRLEAGKVVERELAGGQTQLYRIELKKGQLLQIAAEQQGVDISLQLSTPERGDYNVVNDNTSRSGKE